MVMENGSSAGKPTILVVEDDENIQQLVGYNLVRAGLQVLYADNGEQALALVFREKPDLVILDIMGVRGFDLLNASVSLGFPAVMLTAHALSKEALKQSIEMGASAYIPKEKMGEIAPFLEDVLILGQQSGWKRLFERLGSFFNAKFGPQWQRDEKDFWQDVVSGKYESSPVILKK